MRSTENSCGREKAHLIYPGRTIKIRRFDEEYRPPSHRCDDHNKTNRDQFGDASCRTRRSSGPCWCQILVLDQPCTGDLCPTFTYSRTQDRYKKVENTRQTLFELFDVCWFGRTKKVIESVFRPLTVSTSTAYAPERAVARIVMIKSVSHSASSRSSSWK
jgi:hypothetical protein